MRLNHVTADFEILIFFFSSFKCMARVIASESRSQTQNICAKSVALTKLTIRKDYQ